MGWMAVHNAFDLWALLVDFQVQKGFARSLFDPSNLLAGHIDRADILDLEKAFAVHRWGTQDLIVADANGDVPIVGCCESLVVQSSSDFTNVLLDLVRVDTHGQRLVD
jgi:hypothetical protein